MDITLEPEMYSPSIDATGNYVDSIPPSSYFKHGLRCPCGSRGQKSYISTTLFSNHTKTQHHQKWLQQLNANKTNYFTENVQLKETIRNQQVILSKMEKELHHKNWMIQYLSSQLQNHLSSSSSDSASFSITSLNEHD